MEVVHKSQYFLVEKIIATVSVIVWFIVNTYKSDPHTSTHIQIVSN